MKFLEKHTTISALNLHPGDTVIDFGVGRGDSISEIETNITISGHLYIYDINQELINKIKNESKKRGFINIHGQSCDIDKITEKDLPKNKVDAVVVSNTLFQLESKTRLLGIISKIIKKNGKVLIIDWNSRIAGAIPPKELTLISQEGLKKTMTNLGFDFIHAVPAGEYHFGHIYSKVK